MCKYVEGHRVSRSWLGSAQVASSEGRFPTSSLGKPTPIATYATCDPKHTIVESEPLSLGWSLSMQQMERRAESQWEILESWNTLELIFYNLILKPFPWDNAGVRQGASCYTPYVRKGLQPVTYSKFSFHN